jgi:chromosome segregation ATPase
MKKHILTAVAILGILASIVQSARLNSVYQELTAAREKAASTATFQERLTALETQIAENRGETAALKSSVQARNDELAQLQKKVANAEQNPVNAYAFARQRVTPDGNVIRWNAEDNVAAITANGQMRMTRIAGDAANLQEAEAAARAARPDLAPAMKDGTAKIIDEKNDIVEIQSADGKIIQQLRDPMIAKRVRAAQAVGAAVTDKPATTSTAPAMPGTTREKVLIWRNDAPALTPPPVEAPPTATPKPGAVKPPKAPDEF